MERVWDEWKGSGMNGKVWDEWKGSMNAKERFYYIKKKTSNPNKINHIQQRVMSLRC